jgi:hypothetical protein
MPVKNKRKLQAYIGEDLGIQLDSFKTEQNLNTSEALEQILRSYFLPVRSPSNGSVADTSTNTSPRRVSNADTSIDTLAKLKELEKRIKALEGSTVQIQTSHRALLNKTNCDRRYAIDLGYKIRKINRTLSIEDAVTRGDTEVDTPEVSPVDTNPDTELDTPEVSLVDTELDTELDTSEVSPVDTELDAELDTSEVSPVDTELDAELDTAEVSPVDTSLDTPKPRQTPLERIKAGLPWNELNNSSLAQRLKCNAGTLTKWKKYKPEDQRARTKERDPQGCEWQWNGEDWMPVY